MVILEGRVTLDSYRSWKSMSFPFKTWCPRHCDARQYNSDHHNNQKHQLDHEQMPEKKIKLEGSTHSHTQRIINNLIFKPDQQHFAVCTKVASNHKSILVFCIIYQYWYDSGNPFSYKSMTSISYTLGREYRVMRNRYSRLLFTSEDRLCAICACKNNRWIWRHNASISRSRDVTDQLWWRHNVKSEKGVLGDSCEMSDRWWFLAELCVPGT